MKAIRLHEYGGTDVLRWEEAPKPEPGEGEVLVRVHATSVNPLDWKVRAGYLQQFRPYSLPLILGWDVSGVVEGVGPGAQQFRPGDEVYGRPDIGRDGAYAEYIAVKESELARKPSSVDHVHAAAIPLAGLTAWQALFDEGGLASGQTVLIHAAAGGVGHFAVQFAKQRGARVVGTASGRNQEFLRSLGVDQFIDYERTRFEDVAKDVDVVLDTQAGDVRERSWKTLRKGGILVSILGPPPNEETAKAHQVRTSVFWTRGDGSQLAEIGALVDAGKVRPHIEEVFPLKDAARAHERSAQGHVRGKIALQVV